MRTFPAFCADCGERIYSLGCVNCNEESYIFYDQIYPDGMDASKEFMETVKRQESAEKERRASL